MPDESETLASQQVVAFGRRLFGVSWKPRLAEFAGVSEKNLGRIAAAADKGEEYAAAWGVLAALHEKLEPLADDVARYARQRPPRPPAPLSD